MRNRLTSPLCRVRIRLLALRRQLLLAVVTVAARDLERRDVALALLDLLHGGSDLINNTAELVAQNVALVELYYPTCALGISNRDSI